MLSLYQLWLDDLFPKAKFLDALSMVEKAGHKSAVAKKRKEWMVGETRHRQSGSQDGGVEKTLPRRPAPARTAAACLVKPRGPDATRDGQNRIHEQGTSDHGDQEDLDSLDLVMLEFQDSASSEVDGRNIRPDGDLFADDEAAMAELGGGLW